MASFPFPGGGGAPNPLPMTSRAKKRPLAQPNRFLQVLHHLGWSLGSLAEPQALSLPREFGSATWQAAPLPEGRLLVLVFLERELPGLDASFKAYEDFAPLHGAVAAAFAALGTPLRHGILMDGDSNAQLVDFAAEDVLVDARGEAELTDRILPLLTLGAVARGSLEHFPRKPLGQRARELDDWTRLWSNRLGASSESSTSAMRGFFFWLHLARLAEKLSIGPARRVSFSDYPQATRRPEPVRWVHKFLEPLKEQWNLLQGHPMPVQRQILERAHSAAVLDPCLESYGRVSRGKFSAEVFAEAFADEELRLAGWRQSLIDRPPTASEEPGRWLTEPLTVNLDETGFPGLLRQYDAIVEDLRTLAREQAVARERGVRTGLQMDFFGVEPPSVVEDDAPRLALQRSLRVRTARADRGEVARLVLLARAAEWHDRLRRPEALYPAPHIMTMRADGKVLPVRPELN